MSIKQQLIVLKVSHQKYLLWSPHIQTGDTDINPDRVTEILQKVLQEQSANLTKLLSNCLSSVATELFSNNLITDYVHRNPTYQSVIDDYNNGMKYKSVPELEKHCQLFLDSLSGQGGPVKDAAKALARYWKEEVNKELGIDFKLNVQ